MNKEKVSQMFNRISGKYDFLNHFLSLGVDKKWRSAAINELARFKPGIILDVATGTGDMIIEISKKINYKEIYGIDISEQMLEIAKKKIKDRKINHIYLEKGDSENLKFMENTFDAVSVSFGIRNFENLEIGLSEIFRVLKKGGTFVVLEFSRPKIFPIKQIYYFYFRYLLPLIGKMISQDNSAYSYLPESVIKFPDGLALNRIFEKIGFTVNFYKPLTFGICTLYLLQKKV